MGRAKPAPSSSAAGEGVDVRPNSIRITFTYNGAQERRTLKVNGAPMAPTAANIAHATRVAQEIRDRIRLGRFHMGDYFPDDAPAVSRRTFGAHMDLWLSTKAIEHSTKTGYKSAAKFWKEAQYQDDSENVLGELALEDVKHSHLLYVVADHKETLSAKTLKNYIGPLREAFKLAMRDQVLTHDPSDGVRAPRWVQEPPDPFDREEAEAIIEHMRAKYDAPVHNLTETWFFTGMRTSEVFGLHWPSVDFRKSTMRVHEALVRGRAKATTKTNESRLVDLNSRAMAALKRQKEATFLAGKHVFLDPRYDEPWNDERAFRRSFWTPTLKALGIRYRRPYNMRHSYASWMLMADMNPAYCADQLGHSTEIFFKTYAKWIEGKENARQRAMLEAALARPVSASVSAG